MKIPPPYRHDGRGDLCEAEYEQQEPRSAAFKGCCLLAAGAASLVMMIMMMWACSREVLG